MPYFTALFIGITLLLACIGYVVLMGWNAVSKPQSAVRHINPKERRRDEEAKLNPEQQKLYKHAQALLAEKNVKDAARILESIGMVRKSVSILEKNGFVNVAAEILLRIDRPHRAAVIFARAGKWQHALHCFKIAKMPIEVAKCLHEMGRYMEAARLFEKNHDYLNAAYAFKKSHQLRDVARCLYFSGNLTKSYEFLKLYLKENLHLHDYNLTQQELRLIDDFVMKGEHAPEILHTLVQENYLGDIIYKLIKQDKIIQANDLYRHADSKAIASMIGRISLSNSHSEKIIELFKINNDKVSLAMAYEKIGKHELAGQAYEEVNDLIHALSCYSQCNNDEAVVRVTEKIAEAKAAKKERQEKEKPQYLDSEVSLSSQTQTKRQKLEDCILFTRLTPEQKRRFWIMGQTMKFKEGQEIIPAGSIPKGIYIILSGFVASTGEPDKLIGETSVVGYKDILLNQPEQVGFSAKTTCLIHFIDTAELRNLMDKDGRLTRIIYQNALKMSGQHPEVELPEESPTPIKVAS